MFWGYFEKLGKLKIDAGNFWKRLGYFKFHHLVTLCRSKYTIKISETKMKKEAGNGRFKITLPNIFLHGNHLENGLLAFDQAIS